MAKSTGTPKRESPIDKPSKREPIEGELLRGSMIFVDFVSTIGQPDKEFATQCKVLEHHRIISSLKGAEQGALTSLLTVEKPDGKQMCVSTGRIAS